MESNSINSTENDLNTPQEEFIQKIEEKKDHDSKVNINYGSAKIFSFLFFWWSKVAMNLSNKGELKLDDISYLTEDQKTDSSYSIMEKYVLEYSKNKDRKTPLLLLSLFRFHLWSFILLTIFNHMELILHYLQIFFFRQVILNFSPHENDNSFIIPLPFNILGLILSKVLNTIIGNQVRFFEVLLGDKITNQVNALIYNKALVASVACCDNSKTEAEKLNLVEVDSEKVGFLFFVGPKLITAPIQIVSSFVLLFNFLGLNFVYAFSSLCLLLCAILVLQYNFLRNQRKLLKKKDEVMKIEIHVFHILKMLKMYGWDDRSINQIKEKKNEELEYQKKNFNIFIVTSLLNRSLPLVMLNVTLASYAFADKTFEISDLLTSIQLINLMTKPLLGIPMFLNGFFSNLLSILRIQEFLFSKSHNFTLYENNSNPLISVKYSNCTFGIANPNETPKQDKAPENNTKELDTLEEKLNVKSPNESVIVLNNLSLEIHKGELVGIIGQTGSGKSCLLGSIMNNFDILEKDELIINGSLSFASQTPWIMNETVQDNILFNLEMNHEKYSQVIHGCQLAHDLLQFSDGDKTEISSSGTTLSGGQKARLSLARAVYRDADIYLLDDPLANVDSKVSNFIFKEILCNLLKNKTRILVTNNIGYLECADKIILMEKGLIKWSGTYAEFKHTYQDDFDKQTTKEKKIDEKKEALVKRKLSLYKEDIENFKIKRIPIIKEGKLITEEEINKGKIPISLYHKYIQIKGGYFFFFFILILTIVVRISKLLREKQVAKWAQQSKLHKESHPSKIYNFGLYVGISLVEIITKFTIDYLISKSTLRSLRTLHNSMIFKLVKAPINLFHDIIPIGRILNRLTKDLERVKRSQHIVTRFNESAISLLITIYVCYSYNPYSLLVSPFLLIIGLLISNYYITAGRNLDRFRRTTLSPILSLLSETMLGVQTIRVSQNENNMKKKFYDKMDKHYAVHIFDEGAERWYSVFLDLISHAFYSFIVLFIIIYKGNFTVEAISLILQYSESLSGDLTVTLESLTMIEKGMISLERCNTFILIPSEKNIPKNKSIISKKSSWPSEGVIKFTDYSTRYRPNTSIVLNKINLEIKSKERIGVVGRTGSGKSTLSLCLSRILEPENGKIEIDGIDISALNLEILRQRICLVPQDPFVLEETLRNNLDPFNKCKDSEILEVLDQINLLQELPPQEKLKFFIKNSGANLSLGQKQLISFARAVLKKSKIVVLDESTSSFDNQTETFIKNNFDKYFKQSTLIIIAHRIQMLDNCDRIIVVDNGRIAEVGAYNDLLQNNKSLFSSLYEESLKQSKF